MWFKKSVVMVSLVGIALLVVNLYAGARAKNKPVENKGSEHGVPPDILSDFQHADIIAAPDEVLVKFRPNAAAADKNSAIASVRAKVKKHFGFIRVSQLKLAKGVSVKKAIEALQKNPAVEYAEPNFRYHINQTYPNDPDFDNLWGLDNTGQTGGTVDADIDAPEAWSVSTGSSSIVVAVIDTGVDYTHEDLADNMWTNQAELNGTPGFDDDGNGWIDDVHGIDAYNNDGDPMDDHYHGTHVAGTVGAVGNNSTGVVGVNWNVSIMALKFLSASGSGWTTDAITCIEYAINMGAHVMSNSWGGGGYSHALKEAIEDANAAGILFIAAAGNISNNNDTNLHYPSNYECKNIIAVAATDHNDGLAWFSNYGPTSVDVGAPGVNILSCKPGNSYRYLNGTSMATPHVAGLAALVWAEGGLGAIGHMDVKTRIMRTVDQIPSLTGKVVTEGRINAYRALTEAVSGPYIYSLSPNSGSFGDSVTISGDNFGDTQGSSYVTFYGGITATTITSWSDTQIECIVPNGANTGEVTVTTAKGTSNGKPFTVVVPCYTYDDTVPYSWEEISGTGTNLNLSDDSYAYFSIPFNFNFYCQNYNQVAVGSNGTVYFVDNYLGLSNVCIPGSNIYGVNTFIAGLWDDLNPGAGGAVYWEVKGTAPNRRLIIEWHNVPRYFNIGDCTYEVILYEGTNKILFQYADVYFGSSSYDYGADATVGLQRNETQELQYSCNSPDLSDGLAILFANQPCCPGCTDADGDGYSVEGGECGPIDCNDSDASINPGATEVCDGVDNNCNGQIDEGVLNTYYRDADGDSYGDPGNITQACSAPSGYVDNDQDCNDTDASINPEATEVCGNGIDENCDGVDEPCAIHDVVIAQFRVPKKMRECGNPGTITIVVRNLGTQAEIVTVSLYKAGTEVRSWIAILDEGGRTTLAYTYTPIGDGGKTIPWTVSAAIPVDDDPTNNDPGTKLTDVSLCK